MLLLSLWDIAKAESSEGKDNHFFYKISQTLRILFVKSQIEKKKKKISWLMFEIKEKWFKQSD